MKAILIDDETFSLEVLTRQLQQLGNVEITGAFTDPYEALEHQETLQSDVIFLDMEMGSAHGLQIAEELVSRHYRGAVVFITAYSRYAVEAFEINAVDYLLKPVGLKRLGKTIERLEQRGKSEEMHLVQDRDYEDCKESLQVCCLGQFGVRERGGGLIKWRTKKVRELFAYLWHHQSHPVSRYRIMEDLWPGIFNENATALLHTTVYQLRKKLKEMGYQHPISLVNEQYQLHVPVKSDMEGLQKLLYHTDQEKEAIEQLLALYRGDYMAEDNYLWALQDQQQYRKLVLQYLEKYVVGRFEENRLEPFLESCLERMLQLDEYNEKYMQWLIDYYGKLGNKMKLVETFKAFKRKLKEELGLNLRREVLNIYYRYIQE